MFDIPHTSSDDSLDTWPRPAARSRTASAASCPLSKCDGEAEEDRTAFPDQLKRPVLAVRAKSTQELEVKRGSARKRSFSFNPTAKEVRRSSVRQAQPTGKTLTAIGSPTAEDAQTSQHPKPLLLLVEDNPINLKILTTLATRLSHPYLTATDGLSAVDIYTTASPRPDIILTDISMPIMDGLTATREIRRWESGSRKGSGTEAGGPRERATIVAITGAASEDVKKEASASGVDMFLTKPVKMVEVTRILSAWRPQGASTGDQG